MESRKVENIGSLRKKWKLAREGADKGCKHAQVWAEQPQEQASSDTALTVSQY